jgi:hypothetical protein
MQWRRFSWFRKDMPFTPGQTVHVHTDQVFENVAVRGAFSATVVSDDGGETVLLRWPDATGYLHEEAIPRKLIRGR